MYSDCSMCLSSNTVAGLSKAGNSSRGLSGSVSGSVVSAGERFSFLLTCALESEDCSGEEAGLL